MHFPVKKIYGHKLPVQYGRDGTPH